MYAALTVRSLLCSLHKADDLLQVEFREFIGRYFQFVKADNSSHFGRAHRLRMRFDRDANDRIRRVSWTYRIHHTRLVKGRVIYLTRRFKGPFRSSWIYKTAYDWRRKDSYYRFDRERLARNGIRSQVMTEVRRLRLALANGWAVHAAPGDELVAFREVSKSKDLEKKDVVALVGAAVLDRELSRLADAIGTLVEEFRNTFRNRVEIAFEPELRVRQSGILRLTWVFPEPVNTAQGPRFFTRHIAGDPSDKWMRELGIRTATRREVGAFLKRIRPLERRYRKLVGFLGAHRQRVGELLSRVSRLLQLPGPSALRPAQ